MTLENVVAEKTDWVAPMDVEVAEELTVPIHSKSRRMILMMMSDSSNIRERQSTVLQFCRNIKNKIANIFFFFYLFNILWNMIQMLLEIIAGTWCNCTIFTTFREYSFQQSLHQYNNYKIALNFWKYAFFFKDKDQYFTWKKNLLLEQKKLEITNWN